MTRKSFFRQPVSFFGSPIRQGNRVNPEAYCQSLEESFDLYENPFSSQEITNRIFLFMIVVMHSPEREKLLRILEKADDCMINNPTDFNEGIWKEINRLKALMGESVTNPEASATFCELADKIRNLNPDQLIEVKKFIDKTNFSLSNAPAITDRDIADWVHSPARPASVA